MFTAALPVARPCPAACLPHAKCRRWLPWFSCSLHWASPSTDTCGTHATSAASFGGWFSLLSLVLFPPVPGSSGIGQIVRLVYCSMWNVCGVEKQMGGSDCSDPPIESFSPAFDPIAKRTHHWVVVASSAVLSVRAAFAVLRGPRTWARWLHVQAPLRKPGASPFDVQPRHGPPLGSLPGLNHRLMACCSSLHNRASC